ncbi:hypothetical protein GE21DRAFT_1217676 [Neurospora crassa]|nr:hypothetical protein B9J10.300 [imported] - Neurospora crassa [Neurospora crassa]KHE80697.1 hypothetical protein GE21DRAFT_1217676 [Neurospora crassa]
MAATSQDWPSACPYPIRCPTQMRFVRIAVTYDRNKNSGTGSAASELVMEAMVILNAVSCAPASFSILFGRGSILPPRGHSFLFQPEPKQMLLERD